MNTNLCLISLDQEISFKGEAVIKTPATMTAKEIKVSAVICVIRREDERITNEKSDSS